MTIKHLVISGGGAIGLNYLGILQYLNEEQFWDIENIESIYTTSVGGFVAIVLCLQYDWETLSTYFIERPWQDVFKVTAKQIWDAYYNKGIYDKKIVETIFKPLLQAKDLSLNITLKEFYEYSKKDVYFYTFEMNSFKTIEISHKTHPDLALITVIHMSCALPGLFMPVIMDSECYIDGGFIDNYPLHFCLKNVELKEEILGLNYSIFNNNDTKHQTITKESTILDFILDFSIKSMNHIANSIVSPTIPYEVVCRCDESPVSFQYTSTVIQSKDVRKKMYDDGIKYGTTFLSSIQNKK